MSANEAVARDNDFPRLITDYAQWIARNSQAKRFGEWIEISLPFLDQANDDLVFYAKETQNIVVYSDDGFTLSLFSQYGFVLTPTRHERFDMILRQFGARLEETGEITLESSYAARADGLNRFVQALIRVNSLLEVSSKRVSAYFADDVAAELDRLHVYYTPSVSVRGKSRFEQHFDFVFQRSADQPTRFCQAPNAFTKTAFQQIMWGWNDIVQAPERKGAQLLVIGDDRSAALPEGPLSAFGAYGIKVIPFSRLSDFASAALAA